MIDNQRFSDLMREERKQWRDNSILNTMAIKKLQEEIDMLRKQKEFLQEKLLQAVTNDRT
jgi:hypothetical protein|tara:strand:- start:301 stop:480 length:180 start_codon:yes stop_codon:yes gene_type:complete